MSTMMDIYFIDGVLCVGLLFVNRFFFSVCSVFPDVICFPRVSG
jgi:hypothetical protein